MILPMGRAMRDDMREDFCLRHAAMIAVGNKVEFDDVIQFTGGQVLHIVEIPGVCFRERRRKPLKLGNVVSHHCPEFVLGPAEASFEDLIDNRRVAEQNQYGVELHPIRIIRNAPQRLDKTEVTPRLVLEQRDQKRIAHVIARDLWRMQATSTLASSPRRYINPIALKLAWPPRPMTM